MPLSQIRQSDIDASFDRVRDFNYRTYLNSVKLEKVRGFTNAMVKFDFPVTALVGPNGGGKSTVLGAAACAYKEVKPRTFFPKSSIGDGSMAEWSIVYWLIDKEANPTEQVRKTSRFRRSRWVREDVASRPVFYFGISRTVPAGEKPLYRKLTTARYTCRSPLEELPEEAAREIEHILGKSVRDFRRTFVDSSNTFHVGKSGDTEYSEFHFGAGESSIIRIVMDIESSPESSLILIEEIENGLHPVATKRLVEYLMAAASRRKIQVIFTTHSEDALQVLPDRAVWSCLEGETRQGKLTIRALRAITGNVDKALAIFVEDDFAVRVIETAMREFLVDYYDRVEVHSVSGDANVVRTQRAHALDPASRNRSMGVIDGDSEQQTTETEAIFRLPGGQPERTVFSDVQAHLADSLVNLLTVSMHLPPTQQQRVETVVNSIGMTNRDPHVIFNEIGTELGFLPESIVKGAFISLWLRSRRDDFVPFCEMVVREIEAQQGEQVPNGGRA